MAPAAPAPRKTLDSAPGPTTLAVTKPACAIEPLASANARVPLQVASEVRDLTGLEPGGAKFESRANFDVLAFISSRVAESTVPIDVVEVTTNIDGNIDTCKWRKRCARSCATAPPGSRTRIDPYPPR